MRDGFFLKRRDVQPRIGHGNVEEDGAVISDMVLWSLGFILFLLLMEFFLDGARVAMFIVFDLAE